MKPWGYLSMLVYTIGLPVFFAWTLYAHRHEIQADQRLRMDHLGIECWPPRRGQGCEKTSKQKLTKQKT